MQQYNDTLMVPWGIKELMKEYKVLFPLNGKTFQQYLNHPCYQ